MALLKEFRDGKELEMGGKQELDGREQVLGDMGRGDMERAWDDMEQGWDDMVLVWGVGGRELA